MKTLVGESFSQGKSQTVNNTDSNNEPKTITQTVKQFLENNCEKFPKRNEVLKRSASFDQISNKVSLRQQNPVDIVNIEPFSKEDLEWIEKFINKKGDSADSKEIPNPKDENTNESNGTTNSTANQQSNVDESSTKETQISNEIPTKTTSDSNIQIKQTSGTQEKNLGFSGRVKEGWNAFSKGITSLGKSIYKGLESLVTTLKGFVVKCWNNIFKKP